MLTRNCPQDSRCLTDSQLGHLAAPCPTMSEFREVPLTLVHGYPDCPQSSLTRPDLTGDNSQYVRLKQCRQGTRLRWVTLRPPDLHPRKEVSDKS